METNATNEVWWSCSCSNEALQKWTLFVEFESLACSNSCVLTYRFIKLFIQTKPNPSQKRNKLLYCLLSWETQNLSVIGVNDEVISKFFYRQAHHELRPPANEETLLSKHCFPECFLGAQMCGKQRFLARLFKDLFTENRRLRVLNLGSTAYATTESSQQGFLGAQTGKHLLWKQNVSEKNQKHFLFLGNKKCFCNKCFVRAQTGKHLGKHVSSTKFPQQCSLVCGGLYSWNFLRS